MTTQTATEIASIVGGRALSDAPGGRLDSTNPAQTDQIVATALLGDPSTFAEACRAAREAQRAWREVPAPTRGRAIQQAGRLGEKNRGAPPPLVTREIGKPHAESLGEVQEIIDPCNFFLGEGRRLYGMTVPSEMPDKQLFPFRVPVGVAAIITAGNFPVAGAGRDPGPTDPWGEAGGGEAGRDGPPPRGAAAERVPRGGGAPGGLDPVVAPRGAG